MVNRSLSQSDSPSSRSEEPERKAGGKRPGPMSIARVLGILDQLSSGQGPVSLSDLSRDMAAPKASLLGILGELVALGFVRRDEEGRYLLGGKAYRLASKMSSTGSLSRSVRNVLADVSRELEATVSLGYLDTESRTLVYADRYGESSAVRYTVKYGQATHLHARATAKLLISLQPEDSWADWFGPEPYQKAASRSHTRFATLRPELVEARKNLVAFTHSEQYDGISGCAVPVFAHDGTAAAGLGILMIGESMERNRERVLKVLRSAAESLESEFHLRRITAKTLQQHM